MTTNANTAFVGIDWGTTHRRLYALGTQGQCLQTHADSEGALACKNRFAAALDAGLALMQVQPQQVLMSGMVGSALGWKEVPYVHADVALTDLPRHLAAVDATDAAAECKIVPGYCIRNAWGQPDVMRGEETQLLGACVQGLHTGWFVLPGTHSKWVQLQAGRIVQLRTYMTGELFDVLGGHGTLAAAAGSTPPVWDDAAFAQGLQAAPHSALSQQLFVCRAMVVCGDLQRSSVQSYLSGLLIGAELQDMLAQQSAALQAGPIHFIGTPALARHYLAAATPLQLHMEVLDAQAAYVAALAHFQNHWKLA